VGATREEDGVRGEGLARLPQERGGLDAGVEAEEARVVVEDVDDAHLLGSGRALDVGWEALAICSTGSGCVPIRSLLFLEPQVWREYGGFP